MTGWTDEDLDKLVDDAVFRLKYEQAAEGTKEEQAARMATYRDWLRTKATKQAEDDLDRQYLTEPWTPLLTYRCLMRDHSHCFDHSFMCSCACHAADIIKALAEKSLYKEGRG